MSKNAIRVLVALALLASLRVSSAREQQQAAKAELVPAALSETILKRVAPAYREEAKSLVTATSDIQERWLKLSDEDLTAAVIGQLGRRPAAANFLLAQLEKEPSAKLRGRIIGSLDWRSHPESQPILQHHAASDSDAGVALQALETLRKSHGRTARFLLGS